MIPSERPPGQPSVTPVDSPDRPADVLEIGSRPHPPRRLVVWLTATLALGGVAGFFLGTHHPPGPAPGAAVVSPVADQPLTATGRRCAVQLGEQLQLGIEVANPADADATLVRSEAVLPLPGLRPIARTWGSCGQLPSTDGPMVLAAHGSAWLTVTFDVQVPCPVAIPVRFAVTYQRRGRQDRAEVPGFDDLGGVAYRRCPTSS